MIYVLLIILFYLIICYLIFDFTCKVTNKKTFLVIDKNINNMLKPYKEIIDRGTNWYKEQTKKDLYIFSFDNTRLHGVYIKNPHEKGLLILAHGYRSTKERDLFSALPEYSKLGFSILLLDQRGCGLSDGKYITFGAHESKDINEWVKYVKKEFKPKKIILGGISLGATSVLLVNNKNVDAILTDSGYVNAWDEIKYCIFHYFHIPGIIFMPGVNLFCKLIAKFDLKKTNTLDNLNRLKVPILFAHGLDDDFVLPQNSITNYNYYKHKKDIIFIQHCSHGMGYLVDSEKYISKIKSFLKNVL